MPTLKNLNIEELIIWNENPRINSAKDEKNAILNIVSTQNEKIVNLASDILENGILESIGVLLITDNKYSVREGNRRIVALKLLKNPKIIKHENSKLYTEFFNLSKMVEKHIFESIPAKIYQSNEEDELNHWIELRHLGENKGKGIIPWNSFQKERWKKIRGTNAPLLNLFDYLMNNDILSAEQINNVSKTNWERILLNEGLIFLGITRVKDEYVVTDNKEDFKSKINLVIDRLKNETVKIVYDKEARNIFFNNIKEELINKNIISDNNSYEKDNSQLKLKVENPLDKSDEKTDQPDFNSNAENLINPSNPTKTIKPSDNEEFNFNSKDNKSIPFINTYKNNKNKKLPKPYSLFENIRCDIDNNLDNSGILTLLTELQKLSTSKDYIKYPTATAIMIRSLLEQCLIYLLKQKNRWDKFIKGKKYQPTLQNIIDKLNTDESIFNDDPTLKRLFKSLANNSGTKDYFDMIVHHPHKVKANPYVLETITHSVLRGLIEHILTTYK
ncbi:MAG: hypothetical protein N4A63_02225 [Vallitalea sp.]|jgi:hypothetical protein|nr:hypothetical protein [Vallitalea sp.]